MPDDPDLLKGVLAEDAEVPDDARRLRIRERPPCAECAARQVRCFHDHGRLYETPEGYQEHETR